MDHPEGAGLQRADRVDFDPRVRLEFRGYLVRRSTTRERGKGFPFASSSADSPVLLLVTYEASRVQITTRAMLWVEPESTHMGMSCPPEGGSLLVDIRFPPRRALI